MSIVRLGAVSYLNTLPLVRGIAAQPGLFSLRFDVPARCAELLRAQHVDLGLIPAIEYLHGDYHIVPGVAIGSDGPVNSVALFSKQPVERVASIALDTSSRTSVALTRILCAKRWHIRPKTMPAAPNVEMMLTHADAALIIGDPALLLDSERLGVLKIDLGHEWRELSGLPFVYAMWCGGADACGPAHVAALNAARDAGVHDVDAIAREHAAGDSAREGLVQHYLRDNLRYDLDAAACEGLRLFHELAVAQGIAAMPRELRFFP